MQTFSPHRLELAPDDVSVDAGELGVPFFEVRADRADRVDRADPKPRGSGGPADQLRRTRARATLWHAVEHDTRDDPLDTCARWSNPIVSHQYVRTRPGMDSPPVALYCASRLGGMSLGGARGA